MPEGDTIFRAARRLHRALAGSEVTAFQSAIAKLASLPVPGAIVGRQIERVESVGKHILMHVSGDLVLRTHMRMHGAWHLYRPGERWRAGRAGLRILMETPEWHAVGFRVPVAEWLTAGALARHPALSGLGPDLLSREFDGADAIARLRERGALGIAEALLDQRAIAGIGNVFKSEILFAERVHPFAPVDSLPDDRLLAIVTTARRLLVINVSETAGAGAGRMTTGRLHPDESLWVYQREGRPCHRCGTEVRMQRTGPDARSTYWCPSCQRERSGA